MILQILIFFSVYFRQAQFACPTNVGNCDYRCATCEVSYDYQQCCSCSSGFYLRLRASNTVGAICSTVCDHGTYKHTSNLECTPCDDWCNTCDGPQQTDCTSCHSDAYQLDLSSCYNYPYSTTPTHGFVGNTDFDSNPNINNPPYYQNPCPISYYGIYWTKKCEPCPVGCKYCNIHLENHMPASYSSDYTMANPCPGDGLCSYTLKCFGCTNTNYVLVQGFCITKNRCRTYSWYDSTTSGFNLASCYCKDNFYQATSGTCARCHYSCLTCTGPAATDCVTCPYEQSQAADCSLPASGKGGTYNDTFYLIEDTITIDPASTQWTPTNPTSGTPQSTGCPASLYVFGDYGYLENQLDPSFDSASLNYAKDISGVSEPHYGVRFRATFLFIDQWEDGIGIIFTDNNIQVHAYYYDMQDIVGEYLCGRNFWDHHDVIDFVFPHTGTNINLDIEVTHDNHAWGIKEAVVQLLVCNETCTACDGPTAEDCTGCSAADFEKLYDGICQCDVQSGYFNDTDGTCKQTCTTGYKNPIQRKCTSTCSDFPYLFIHNGECVEHCPNTHYKYQPTMTCQSVCYDPTNSKTRYKYDHKNGEDKICYDVCPDGYYGDPTTGSCVTQCPKSTSSNAGHFAEGKVCVQWCDTSNDVYAYHPTRQCVATECPAGYYRSLFTDSDGVAHKICEQVCSITLSGDHELGDNTTMWCKDLCPEGSYADYTINMCVKHCNQSAYEQVIDDGTDIIRTCQLVCDTANYALYGNQLTGKCSTADLCPENQFGDPLTTYCTTTCSKTEHFGRIYSGTNLKLCTDTCAADQFKQNDTKLCVKTCPQQNDNGNPEYGDQLYTGFCLQQCVNDTFADIQDNRQCVQNCSEFPAETYGENYECVFNCSATNWADPFGTYRLCVPSCTHNANTKSYGYNQTRSCVTQCPDTQFGIVLSTLPVCVFVCVDTFGDPGTNLCVDDCPFPLYGDQSPTGNRSCLQQCPDQYFAENTTAAGVISSVRLCVLACSYGWADNQTRACAIDPEACSEGLYAHQTNHKCVLPLDCTGFADPTTKKCVPTCPYSGGATYYGDSSTGMCVLICPQDPDTYGDNNTHECETVCSQPTLEVKDPQNLRRCVSITACSRTPLALYADLASNTCVTSKNCSADTYADNSTNKCQDDCQDTTNQYADSVSGECVSMCNPGYYGLNVSANEGICSLRCPLPEHADNLTVQCTTQCSTLTYGVNYTDPVTSQQYGICEIQCPPGQYARDVDNLCVLNCGDGGVTGLWGNNQTRRCITDPKQCPEGTYANSHTHNCVYSIDCSEISSVQYVADNVTQKCISQCPDNTGGYLNWADMAKNLCVRTCPEGFFGYNKTKVCQTQCKDDGAATFPAEYADWQLQICVKICSAAPVATFGQDVAHTCVLAEDCPGETWAQIEVNDRKCIATCPNPNEKNGNLQKYADNITKTCVETCPTHFYGDLQRGYGMCVYTCPKTNDSNNDFQFSDNLTKTCVTVCPESQNTWGDVVSLMCVKVCPQGYFAQKIPHYKTTIYRHCVDVCAQESWGEIVQRTCVDFPSDCPTINGTHQYADNSTHLCVNMCPQSEKTWGQNTTWACQDDCTTGFKYNDTNVCIDICPPGLDGDDGSFSDQGMCYYICITPNYYRDPQNARSCQPTCSFSPDQYYADSTTMKCVHMCPAYPQYYYAYDDDKTCRTDCPLNTMRDHLTRKCVSTCPANTFFDSNSDSCVEKCPTEYEVGANYYGDTTAAIPECVVATSCPNSYFSDDVVGLCVQTCSENQWKFGKNCITHCPNGYYGNFDTGFCVIPANCPDDHYAENQTRTCVQICNGTFADTSKKVCVSVCPDNYYADPVTRLCTLSCTNNASVSLHLNVANKTCVSGCEELLYLDQTNNSCEASCPNTYFADRTTQICVKTCPSVPPLFGDEHKNLCVDECDDDPLEYKHIPTRMCVDECPPTYFRNNHTRFCVEYCTNITYADEDSGYCVLNCTPKYSLDDPNICTSSCPSPYYRDPTTYKCVLQCPTHPQTYYKVVTANDRRCDTNCPSGQYRDKFSFSCVTTCPPSPPTYADSSTGNCVTVCPTMYAHKQSRTCMSPCPSGMFATDLTRECVNQCINGTDTYADSGLGVPACVSLCSPGTFANPNTLTCDPVCGSDPKTYGYENGTHRICLQSCPYPSIADDKTHECETKCTSVDLPYLDKASKSCVASCSSLVYKWSYLDIGKTTEGQCLEYCPPGRFALQTNFSCIQDCPSGLYGETENNTCQENCSLANNNFADSQSRLCVPVCPYNDTYDSYGDLFSRTCVTSCPKDKHTVADSNTRLCEPSCTVDIQYINPSTMKCVTECPETPYMFADPVSQTCVDQCSLYTKRYGYEGNRTCVQKCPIDGLYANDETRRCVTAWNCQSGFYGLDPQRICVEVCPTSPSLFADPFVQNLCVPQCPPDTFAESHSRMCVQKCSSVPALFGYVPLKQCREECPPNYFADNHTRECVANCSTGGTIVTYADNSTYRCVTDCPSYPNYFASDHTFECVSKCPQTPSLFADYSTRKCVAKCPAGELNTFADTLSRQCVRQCPDTYFMQNSTRECVQNCTEGFADPQTRYCIAVCPAYTYGYLTDRTCKTGCPEESPQLYAEDNTNLCVAQCLQIHNTYADDTNNRCVQICPIDEDLFSEEISQRKCVANCSQSPFQLADFSTRSCVPVCPTIPSLFGVNNTRRCEAECPEKTWADNETRRCVSLCPDTPDTYGDNSTWSCVLQCPTKPMTFSDNFTRTCVQVCSEEVDYYADNATRRCVKHCSNGTFAHEDSRKCIETCPTGLYGYNKTYRCIPTCPEGQFADHLLHLCVQKCSVDPIYYGNPDTHICVEECPAINSSFGNPLTQECVKYFDRFSGCPNYLYADNVSRLCVPVCPLDNDTYGDNSTWKCVETCPGPDEEGFPIDTFSDNSTMMCVSICPEYPEYYAEQYSRRCVFFCLDATPTYSGSFADNSTRKCVQKCPSNPDYFSDNSTKRCVFYCPQKPQTFADQSTRRCVQKCPSDPDIYGDNSTLRCVQKCPQEQATYADHSTRLCVKVCPEDPSLYGQNQTNRCMPTCPNGSYADDSSRICVAVCPQYPDTYGDPWNNLCVQTCPDDPDSYADPISQTCVLRCPDGLYAQNDTRRCVPRCPQQKVNYADNVTNRCVSRCPESNQTYGDNSTRKCVYQCPQVPFTYADNMTRMCLSICNNVTEGGWAQNNTRICVQKCPDQSYGDNFTRYCVRYCPQNYFGYPVDNVCVEQCPAPYFGDNSTEQCVLVCPGSQLLFGQNIDRTCTAFCPEGTYADSYSQQCVQVCPGAQHDTFAFQDNNTCLQQCPIPLYGYPVKPYRCIDECINPYYENITDHRCHKCPDECQECQYTQLCITCIENHYLYSGRCLQSCPTFPIITYANPNRVCGTAFQCTAGYFALNTTKSCVKSCPSGFYKNETLQTCDSCLRGCSYCTNSSACITCNSTIAIWDDYKCHLFCSVSRKYYTTSGCTQVCPNGTYLQLNMCYPCSQICQRCIVQPQNCLSCANGYYLSNNLCVSECPANTKAVSTDGSLVCTSCDIVDCQVTPLTYQVEQFIENYQYSIKLKFSEPIDLTKDISEIIKIRPKTGGRLLQTVAKQTVDYTIYDYGNGQYVFVLNNFDARQHQNLEFEVQITEPEAIISKSGQFPETTRKILKVQTEKIYSKEDYNQAIAIYCEIVVIVSIILLIMTFSTKQSIWMPIIDFYHMLFALLFVNMTLPPNPTYALSKFKLISLNFLPNVFESSLIAPVFDKKSTSNTLYTIFGDMIFVRTLGHLFLMVLILIFIMVVMLIIWKKGPERFKSAKKFCKTFLKETFWKKHLHGLIYLFFMPVMLIGLMKMWDYTTNSAAQNFSIFLSYLFMISMLVGISFFTYKVIRLLKDNPSTCLMIQKGYDYISNQEIILDNNEIYKFNIQTNQIDLSEVQMPRINQLLILPYPIETRFGKLEVTLPLLQYLYKLLICIFLVASFGQGTPQLFLLLILGIINLIYFSVVKPYIHIPKKQYNNYLSIHNICMFLLIVIAMIVLQMQQTVFTYQERVLVGDIISGIIIASVTVNVIYFIYRTYDWYDENVWRPFVHTQIFKNNYTMQFWQYQKLYKEIDHENKKNCGKKEEFQKAIMLTNARQGFESVLDDPTLNRKKKAQNTDVKLRPNRNQQFKKQISKMFNNFNDEKQKSHKSIRSSERLSKQDRNRVREQIFGDRDMIEKEDDYQEMKIVEVQEQNNASDESETEYQYEYIEQQYPEGTPMEQIMKNCKKGEFIMP